MEGAAATLPWRMAWRHHGLRPALHAPSKPGLLAFTLPGSRFAHRRFFSTTTASSSTSRHYTHPLLQDVIPDETNNVPASLIQRLGVNLHRQPFHPLNTCKRKIERYFTAFPLEEGKDPHPQDPHRALFRTYDNFSPIVSVKDNFDDLLFPEDHVGRSPNDTYYLNRTTLLRTHTSAHQNQLLREGVGAFLVTGDVYRRDTIDRTHSPVFHQMEGVRVFEPHQLSLNEEANLQLVEQDMKSKLEGMVRSIFGPDLVIRWVDAYFPFTHPSWEMEIFFEDKDWLEVLGCGVVHQDIMRQCGLGAKKGWAFGIGLERLAMILFGIPDIRLFWVQDKRFLSQFLPSPSSSIPPEEQVLDMNTKFKPFSKYPLVQRDIAFWLPAPSAPASSAFHENSFFEVVRGVGNELVESVEEVDRFVHPKKGVESRCYRISYRSMERSLTNEEINQIQEQVRHLAVEKLGVTLR
ncbi:phenylalanine--tRNA ligase [Balamuthia mandrillaris]